MKLRMTLNKYKYRQIAGQVLREYDDLADKVYSIFKPKYINQYKCFDSLVFVDDILNKLDKDIGLFYLERFETPEETVHKIFQYKIPKILKEYLVEFKLDEIQNDF
jgi:hypothetical protein